MIQDEIIRMALESGVWDEIGYPKCIERFAALIAAHEREACANVCDIFAENETGFVAEDCAAAIRARGEK